MNSAPYALGFSSQENEVSRQALPLRGSLPTWLNGQLIRTGPAKFEIGKQSFQHWFDGLAMLYKFNFSAGRVNYSNRYLRGRSYCESLRAGNIRRDGFGTKRSRTWLEKLAFLSRLKTGDNCNVNVVRMAHSLVALTETPTPIRFNGETLETQGNYDFRGKIKGQVSTAHPHFDFQRACHYNYLLEFGATSKYHFYAVSAKSRHRQHLATIPVKNPAYMHSFAMTERYLILTEFPYLSNALRFLVGRKAFIQNYGWEPSRGTLFHVVEKDSGERVKTAASEAFFAFHHVNAFEKGRELVIDIAAYPDASIIDQLYLSPLRSANPATDTAMLRRYRLGLDGSHDVRAEALADTPLELPRIDYSNCAGRPYRYVYGAGRQPSGEFIDNLVKVDTESGSTTVWHETGCYPGEPVYVAAPEAATEDQGVLLSVVLDTRRKTSFLLVLAADSLAELARAYLPHHLPFGFHGNFFGAQ